MANWHFSNCFEKEIIGDFRRKVKPSEMKYSSLNWDERDYPNFPSAFEDLDKIFKTVRTAKQENWEIHDDIENFLISVLAPGVDKNDFQILAEVGKISISYDIGKGNSKLIPSKFSQSWTIPSTVDIKGITATYEQGILRVSLPKILDKKEEIKFRIEVK